MVVNEGHTSCMLEWYMYQGRFAQFSSTAKRGNEINDSKISTVVFSIHIMMIFGVSGESRAMVPGQPSTISFGGLDVDAQDALTIPNVSLAQTWTNEQGSELDHRCQDPKTTVDIFESFISFPLFAVLENCAKRP